MTDETTYDNHARLYESVLLDKRLTDSDIRILGFIKCRKDGWQVSQIYISKQMGISLSKVKNSINRLDSAGYLEYKVRKTDGKVERRDMTMLHKPTHWNDLSGSDSTGQIRQVNSEPFNSDRSNMNCSNPQVKSEQSIFEPSDRSNLNHAQVKFDLSDRSNLNHNEELTKSIQLRDRLRANEESNTELVVEEKRIDYSQIPDEILMKEDSEAGAEAYARVTAKIFGFGRRSSSGNVQSGLIRSSNRDSLKFGGQS